MYVHPVHRASPLSPDLRPHLIAGGDREKEERRGGRTRAGACAGAEGGAWRVNTLTTPYRILYSKGLSERNRLAGGSQLISKFLREIEPTVSQFLNVHAFRK